VVVASGNKDNIYHDRETTKSRKSNPAGSKDANVRRSEKDQQFEYQQERLKWRADNQGKDATLEGVNRMEPPHTNMAGDMSAERRGPDMDDSGPHGDTLKELVDNVKDAFKGKKHNDNK
jgi:hypothetical protein